MTSLILINGSHWDTENKQFKYRFPIEQQFDANTKIALLQCNMFHSWYNITSAKNNNTLKIQFPSGASDWITITITLADGYYSSSSLNLQLQKAMYDNKLYTTIQTQTRLHTI